MSREMHAGFSWGDLKERDHLEDLGVDGCNIKMVLK
jgi:hypothetical protein